MTLDPKFKAAWVKALRSGKYDQGNNRLATFDGKFCCLGVACDVIEPGGWRSAFGEWEWAWLTRNFRTAVPDEETCDAIGLPTSVREDLSMANDEHGATFAQIADWVEREAWDELEAFVS